MPLNIATSIAERMKTVKQAWDSAPPGPKKDAALQFYQAAETAHAAWDDADCARQLDAAKQALV